MKYSLAIIALLGLTNAIRIKSTFAEGSLVQAEADPKPVVGDVVAENT